MYAVSVNLTVTARSGLFASILLEQRTLINEVKPSSHHDYVSILEAQF